MLRSVVPAVFELGLGAIVIALVLGALQPVVAGVGFPGPGVWLALTALTGLAAVWVIAPLAVAAGAVAGLARWRRSGGWLGLRSVGVRGRQLIPAMLVVGLAGGAVAAAGTQVLGPSARGQIRVLAHQPGNLALLPGVEVRLGDLAVVARGVGGGWATELFLASPSGVGSARRGRLIQAGEGPALELIDGALLTLDPVPVRLAFRRWIKPIDLSPRVELDELSTPELRARADATAARGGDASYERAVAYKRWLHPFATFLMPLALLPLGVRRHPMAWVGLCGVGYLVSVRVGDHLAPALGGMAGAAFGPAFIAALGVFLWATWRDR